jgi:hypothetical protein
MHEHAMASRVVYNIYAVWVFIGVNYMYCNQFNS